MKIYIKGMVNLRCKMIVIDELKVLDISCFDIELGTVDLIDDLNSEKHDLLKISLSCHGLELLDNKKIILIEKIKSIIISMIHYSNEVPKMNFSDFISEKLNYDYTYLANIFSEINGITIQQFIMNNKIEKIKELLIDDELNLTEISFKLHYSSSAHLSNQFKKVTGSCPSTFKKSQSKRNKTLENAY